MSSVVVTGRRMKIAARFMVAAFAASPPRAG